MSRTTKTGQYKLLRGLAGSEGGSAINLTTGGGAYSAKPADAVNLLEDKHQSIIQMQENALTIPFLGLGAEDSTFTWKLYAWRTANGFARLVAEGGGTLGTQTVVEFPHNGETTASVWADTLTVDSYNWYKRVESTSTAGNNSVAEIWLDDFGWKYWRMEATMVTTTSIAAYYGFV